MRKDSVYKAKNNIRIVTATSLFDGHDATINIIRRIIQASGGEVIHLGHNRSVQEIVNCAIQEDAQAIAVTSYQGGHIEFYKYMFDLLKEKNAGHIQIFGGGGGVILPDEIKELHDYGIAGIYSPDDGRSLGLQGMINDLLGKSDFAVGKEDVDLNLVAKDNHQAIAQLVSASENYFDETKPKLEKIRKQITENKTPVIGITGTGGAGKSSLTDEIVRRFINSYHDLHIGIISVDPTRRKTGGALLGDRIRMNSIDTPRVYMRSLATRQSKASLSEHVDDAIDILKYAGYDIIIVESSGIGQADTEIIDKSDLSIYVMTPEYGAASQLEKISMLDYADLVAINKFDKRGAEDALKDVKKQYQRNHNLFDQNPDSMPVYGTMASHFNDQGVNLFFLALIEKLKEKINFELSKDEKLHEHQAKTIIIPPSRTRYLSEISDTVRQFNKKAEDQSKLANRYQVIHEAIFELKNSDKNVEELETLVSDLKKKILPENIELLDSWKAKTEALKQDTFTYKVRNKDIQVQTFTESLSHLKIPKIAIPKYTSWGDILKWQLKENFPGEFPFAAGVFPFKREQEDPTRMFAGEGAPERTNKRFHYLSRDSKAKRLSTAFDSVTLYGSDPAVRPDIYGKVGNSGVSIASLDDAKKLYSGFDLMNPMTSVSMTINGPAPMLMAYFLNTAIDQQCEVYIKENNLIDEVNQKIENILKDKKRTKPKYVGDLPETNDGLGLYLLGVSGDEVLPEEVYQEIKAKTMSQVRGTVQADILKEDQAQNTCIFSTEFSLKMMGDIQQYFIDHKIRNFYSVSISGYHIAEAGANPITQLALTLANGFTFVEYYLARGMHIDEFAPNLSFFFSNGIDPEYSVIGRVARIIWSKAMKYKYDGNERSQKLKYHIQTSGRSLHAQEIEFNDIRTTLQALTAIYDNCNSLHTNAYDEAITTPTEESVRRAVAIQMIINHEFGLAKNQNPLQGSFIIEELTDLVEEAVLVEFDRISERGGVLGAMETMYQRSKIQEESLYYESLKHSGELPIMGVNTFLSSEGSPTIIPDTITRSTEEEKNNQVNNVNAIQTSNKETIEQKLTELQEAALSGGNTFEYLLEATKYCTIGQITEALYEVGGQYRRNM